MSGSDSDQDDTPSIGISARAGDAAGSLQLEHYNVVEGSGVGGGSSSSGGGQVAYSEGTAGASAAAAVCPALAFGADPTSFRICGLLPGQAPQPAEVAASADAVVLTSRDVALLMVGGSGLVRQPPGPKVLISKQFIVYTSPDTRTLTTTVGGTAVDVDVTPVSYRWDWGDGTSTTTTDPGAAWPYETVFHHYASTATSVVTTLTTTWTARFRPQGQDEWTAVTGSVTTSESSTPYDLVRAVTYLTDDAEEAQGH